MNTASRNAKDIFLDLIRNVPPAGWDDRMREFCGDDEGLLRRVEDLLRAHVREGSFLDEPAVGVDVTVTVRAESAGSTVGPYKLMEQIGEGGMGVVYVAEQTEPVRRKVALKVIKPGMDTKQVIARFEAERQALALMDHPNIAKVLDAGNTESGRPYFVMELVRGVPITDYCDREHLSIPERLDLFVLVCRAVQHAHQKGIIHRDIKPTNVLVTLHDGVPVPKVIDFGIAKATGQSLTDRTLYTGFAQLVGTPLYMSPEQAEMSGLDVDTRSDIYSLGVLLYELLTGTTPFDQETMRKAALDEMRRIIREEEPPKPSTRLSALGDTTTVSANRRLDPRHLGRAVRGELDWIVMRALEKDRRRRYETANDFAADVMRFLTDQPVEACPPSSWYRFGKFARRNRAALTTGGLVGLALVAGVALSTWQAVRATRAERESRRQAAVARTAVDAMYTQFAEKVLGDHPQLDPVQREFLEKALAYYQALSRERGTDPEIREEAARATSRVGKIRHQLGQYPEALTAYLRALELDEALVRDFPARPKPREFLAKDRCMTSDLLYHLDRLREARDVMVRAIEVQQELLAGRPGDARYLCDLANCQGGLGLVLREMGRHAEAEQACDKARDLLTRLVAEHPEEPDYRRLLSWVDEELGLALAGLGRRQEAEDALKRSVEHAEKLNSKSHGRPGDRERLAHTLRSYGELKGDDGKHRQAEEAYRRALAIREALVAEFPDRAGYRENLAASLTNLGALLADDRLPADASRLAEAERYCLRALEINEKRVAELPTPSLRTDLEIDLVNLALLTLKTDRYEETERYARRAIEVMKEVGPHSSRRPLVALGGRSHNKANVLKKRGEKKVARRLYELALVLEQEALKVDPKDPQARDNLARHYIELCSLTCLEDPVLAGRLARSALELGARLPEELSDVLWQTLGWAEYRRRDWQASIRALEKSSAFSRDGDFIGAMALWQRGDKAAARASFARADDWLRGYEKRWKQGEWEFLEPCEYRLFRAEAADLLGLSDPPAAEPKSPPRKKDGDR